MGFIKEKETEYGFVANYWRVNSITTDKESKRGSFVISLFKDKDSADNSSKSIDNRYVNFFIDLPYDMPEEEREKTALERYNKYFALGNEYPDMYAACYAMAKELDPYFSDAKDC